MAAGALTVSMLGGGGPASADQSPDRALVEKMATTLSLPSPPGAKNQVKVLVFHASAGDEAPYTDAGIAAIEKIGLSGPEAQRFTTVATADPKVFTNGKRLGSFHAVVFLTGG
ncbi:ThuA domain-containing protein, partial [Streptomyces sp. SID7982]|nr:ThuA domain-containing protein [Streptomyces sp. SID7982]